MSKSQAYRNNGITDKTLAGLAAKRYFSGLITEDCVQVFTEARNLTSYSGRTMDLTAHVIVPARELRKISLVNDFGILVGADGATIHADSELRFNEVKFQDCYNFEATKMEAERMGYSVAESIDEQGVLTLDIETY
jgi:hypothetical protein